MKYQSIPLAERLRPTSLDQYIGQEHLVGENAVLRRAIESGRIHSMIFWGPPGVGKTTLASIISKQVKRQFYVLSAVSSGVKEVREVFDRARMAPDTPILFIDEIHRFSKSQQDSLLNAVEKGLVILIGATTENPSFEVISPLLSRCQVYVLKSLEKNDLDKLLDNAVSVLEKDYGKKIELQEKEALMHISGGDARKLLNAIDLVVGMIYESRPNVTADAFGLCFKTGNAVILKGGSDAIYSNKAIVEVIQNVLSKFPNELPINNDWIISPYAPTPTIVEAAKALYQNHSVNEPLLIS